MRKSLAVVSVLALLMLAPLCVLAQGEGESAPQGPNHEVLQSWDYVQGKLVTMAEDFPEKLYDYKPTPEVRSFAEQLLHVAGSNLLFVDTASGRKPGEETLSREKYPTKADVVAVLKKSVEEGARLIEAAGDDGIMKPIKHPFSGRMVSQYGFWMAQVEHAGEHYGQLVVYYRVNGMVPPASRRRSN
jgi:uncharacterized damage-inducible protein DinB